MSQTIRGRSNFVAGYASAAVCALIVLIGSAAAAQTTTTGGLPDDGVLRLQLGAVDRLVWETPSTSDTNPTQSLFDRRSLTGRSFDKCLLQIGAIGDAPTLLGFAAGVPTSNQPGFAYDAIGVFGGGGGSTARGVDCSRVGANESLTLSLVGSLSGRIAYRSELDIEVKQSARILATASAGGSSTTWELRSGASIVSGQGSTVPGSPIFNCNAASDSGSDSGPNDNCRWTIPGVWDSLELRTLAGEWSLEGGADFGSNAFANNSLFFLTRASGILDCGDTTITAGGGGSALVSGSRLANAGGSACVPIPYLLESTGNNVSFLKDLLGQTDAAVVFDITWTIENAMSLPAIPLSFHSFDGVTFFDLDVCVGTPSFDTSGNLTGLSGVPDLDPSLPGNQYACVSTQQVDYVDTDTIEVRQRIYLEGDWTAGRR